MLVYSFLAFKQLNDMLSIVVNYIRKVYYNIKRDDIH